MVERRRKTNYTIAFIVQSDQRVLFWQTIFKYECILN